MSRVDLILYELMMADFTAGYRGTRAAADAVADKLPWVTGPGVNAVEFMPWVAWPDTDTFSWGYDPAFFFSVESGYVTDPSGPMDKLARLAGLISKCHAAGLMVLLDIVLQHASAGAGTRGFPYYWLWQAPDQSPFVGNFTNAGTFGSLPLDYHNDCTLRFVTDVCVYWAERFGVDGFRFGQVWGYNNPDFPLHGAPALIANLKRYFDAAGVDGAPLILEDTWDYGAVADTNAIGATHGWFDVFRSRPAGYLAYGGRPQPEYLRVLNASRDFRFPTGPVTYVENHDHSTVAQLAGGRDWWFRTQPYAIALATCPGAIMIANGQEFGRSEYLPEDDSNLPPDQQRVNPRPLLWPQAAVDVGERTVDQVVCIGVGAGADLIGQLGQLGHKVRLHVDRARAEVAADASLVQVLHGCRNPLPEIQLPLNHRLYCGGGERGVDHLVPLTPGRVRVVGCGQCLLEDAAGTQWGRFPSS